MEHRIKLCVIGGFLGSGKTTVILSIAGRLLDEGKKVGIVTNDKGSDLVDTDFLRREGFSVLEVAGGCFCCHFDEFIDRIKTMSEREMPDVILAEPVGSCTDLFAAIVRPILSNYGNTIVTSPLIVLADPRRIAREIAMEGKTSFTNEVSYLFRKQLEEGDIIALNKRDLLSDAEAENMISYLRSKFPAAELLSVSARSGMGVPDIVERLMLREAEEKGLMELDYRIYKSAERALGWLNGTCLLRTAAPIDYSAVVVSFMDRTRSSFAGRGKEIAHLKLCGVTETEWVKSSVTASDPDQADDPSRLCPPLKPASWMNVVINARILDEPDGIRETVERELSETAAEYGLVIEGLHVEAFKSGNPNPLWRVANMDRNLMDSIARNGAALNTTALNDITSNSSGR